MTRTAAHKMSPEDILKEGWDALVKRLGYTNATAFVMSLEQGHGDSVKDIGQEWEDKSVQEITDAILKWKKRQTRK